MRRRTGIGLGLIAALALTACGPGSVSIVVELEDEGGGEAALLEDVEIRLLPYDRDHIFDSLTQAAPSPEPPIPPALEAAREEIAQLQRDWTEREAEVAEMRESINSLNEQLEGLNPAMNEYKRLFDQVNPMLDALPAREAEAKALFDRFVELQEESIEQIEAIRIERANWGDQAFRDVSDVIDARIDASGLEEAADTTGVNGAATIEVSPGQYWIYARYELPYDELYWNVPVTVVRGEPAVVTLNRSNAVLRPIL